MFIGNYLMATGALAAFHDRGVRVPDDIAMAVFGDVPQLEYVRPRLTRAGENPGVLARRVVFWKQKGDHVAMGEPIGLMKFSSRMDVIMPPEVEVTVKKGERVVGGITIIGRVRQSSGAPTQAERSPR